MFSSTASVNLRLDFQLKEAGSMPIIMIAMIAI